MVSFVKIRKPPRSVPKPYIVFLRFSLLLLCFPMFSYNPLVRFTNIGLTHYFPHFWTWNPDSGPFQPVPGRKFHVESKFEAQISGFRHPGAKNIKDRTRKLCLKVAFPNVQPLDAGFGYFWPQIQILCEISSPEPAGKVQNPSLGPKMRKLIV